MRPLEVRHDPDDEKRRYSVYEDVAERFWPGDTNVGNHAAQALVVARLLELGCQRVPGWADYRTPAGEVVGFDSESGVMEFHSGSRGAVELVAAVIEGLEAAFELRRRERDEPRPRDGEQMRWAVDVPSADPREPMIPIDYFETREAAVEFARRAYGADEEGRVGLVSEIPDAEE